MRLARHGYAWVLEHALRRPALVLHAVYLNGSGRRKIIAMYENRVNDESMYNFQGQQVSYRYIFQMQAQAMARLILGEAREYAPFMVR
jgi:CRISPR/Cas system-associated endonuclease Cas1